ncbi:PREDICTED: uncharacterized protein LOC104740052 [Camelina sativa]|uniref:Uncharacterized protein LOC104740052 n=1 Tax=Camelina sativa TaxID=90675 RepID=A0ABM0VNJ0_CAMSA|nr:PREDICTED: uncharacterized protein LOC104740052 [Camelina sativa]
MGTKVHCESLFGGYHHSMGDLNKESNGCRWPLFYSDSKTSAAANDQCYNGFPSQTTSFGYDKDLVRRTMLEHEAVFKTQVLELHRVYSIQKDMMEELKRKQLNNEWAPIEASFSSQATNVDARKWKIPTFPLANSVYDRPSMSVVEDNGHSPMKGSSSQVVVGPVSWQNGASSKNVETSEARPTKIRRKMIDLCLPADEYIDDNDEVVELKDHRVCSTSSQLPNGDVKTESRGDGLRIKYGSSRSNGLADLNEPLNAQETNEFAYGHPRNGEFQGHIRDYGKSLNSGSVREHVPVISLHSDENNRPKAWPLQPLRNDHYTGTHKSAAPFFQAAKPLDSSSQHMQVLMNSSQRVMSVPNSGPPSKPVFWRERTFIDLEADTDTNSSHEAITHQNHVESSLACHQQSRLYPYNPPDSAVSWNHLQSSWQNPSFGFSQKVASAQRYPVLNFSDTLSGNTQKQGFLGDRLQYESNSRFNSGCGSSSRLNNNMFYNECSSSSKPKFAGVDSNYPNGGRSDYSSEMKFVRDLNLNVTLSNTPVVEVRKDEERLATLPWLNKPKSVCNSEMADVKGNLKSHDVVLSSTLKPLDINDEAGEKVQNIMWLERLKSGSCSSNPETEKFTANVETPGSAFRDQSKAGKGKVRNVRMLDMNEPCDPLWDEDQQTEEQIGTKVSVSNRCQIDLNMLVSDDEGENCSVPASSRVMNSKGPMIDLESVPESDDDEEEDDNICAEKPSEETPVEEKTLEKPPEFEKLAAETIVSISSACLDRELEVAASPEVSETIILHWFAETVNAHKENLDEKLDTLSRNQSRSIEEIDYFESMTLQLPEISEEEYMPKPLVPEDLKLEETTGTTLVTSQRPRRGNARKGKQRRDFQRDILPGLVSLSKHEVTEDIQMFDGFMRAAGSSWTPTGLTRKKTGARGRPRRVITIPAEPVYIPVPAPAPAQLVHQQHVVSNQNSNGETEVCLEDRRFAGWGKMTRRPRGQRCPSTTTTVTTASNQRSSSHAPFT